MMPHEYEKEIRSLRAKSDSLSSQMDYLKKFVNSLDEKLKNQKESHGQANSQDTARHQENDKGHKKARKDGQES